MKIQPVQVSITDPKPAVEMKVTASDVWGDNGNYEAISTLLDEDKNIVAQLKVNLQGEAYQMWDGNNKTILDLILNTYPFIKI